MGVPAPAVGADALDHVIDGSHLESLGKGNDGNGRVVETESAVALLAEEMGVQVVVLIVVVLTAAQLVAHVALAVLHVVHQMVVAEELQRAEDARLVDGEDLVLQVLHRHGAPSP